jgi:hypothetical protein
MMHLTLSGLHSASRAVVEEALAGDRRFGVHVAAAVGLPDNER